MYIYVIIYSGLVWASYSVNNTINTLYAVYWRLQIILSVKIGYNVATYQATLSAPGVNFFSFGQKGIAYPLSVIEHVDKSEWFLWLNCIVTWSGNPLQLVYRLKNQLEMYYSQYFVLSV